MKINANTKDNYTYPDWIWILEPKRRMRNVIIIWLILLLISAVYSATAYDFDQFIYRTFQGAFIFFIFSALYTVVLFPALRLKFPTLRAKLRLNYLFCSVIYHDPSPRYPAYLVEYIAETYYRNSTKTYSRYQLESTIKNLFDQSYSIREPKPVYNWLSFEKLEEAIHSLPTDEQSRASKLLGFIRQSFRATKEY